MSKLKLDFSNLKHIRGNPNILLAPPIPLPLHTVNPRNIKGEEWWDGVRHKAYEYNEGCCWCCGIHGERLEAHEIYEIDEEIYCMTLKAVVALCNMCHSFIHRGFVHTQVVAGKISHQEQKEIINHGIILLNKGKIYDEYISSVMSYIEKREKMKYTWDKWYLHFDGKRYYSPFKNYLAWQLHFESL